MVLNWYKKNRRYVTHNTGKMKDEKKFYVPGTTSDIEIKDGIIIINLIKLTFFYL